MVFLVNGVLRCSSSSNKTWYSAWLLDAATGIIPERASLVFDRMTGIQSAGIGSHDQHQSKGGVTSQGRQTVGQNREVSWEMPKNLDSGLWVSS